MPQSITELLQYALDVSKEGLPLGMEWQEAAKLALIEPPKVYACPECGKTFRTRSACDNHCKDCAGDKPIGIRY